MQLPYENATSGLKARQEILGILKRFGILRLMAEYLEKTAKLDTEEPEDGQAT